MARSERVKIPDEVKKAKGTFQKCRANPDPPVVARVEQAHPPPDLFLKTGYERDLELWYYFEPMARQIKVLATSDISALQRLCETQTRYEKALHEFKTQHNCQCLTTNSKGDFVLNPLSKQLNELTHLHNRLLCEFGFTPASRTRVEQVKTQKSPTESPLAKIMALKAKG